MYIVIRCLLKITNIYQELTRVKKSNILCTGFPAERVYNLIGQTGSIYKKSNKVTHKSYNRSSVRAIFRSRGRNQEIIANLFCFQVLKKIALDVIKKTLSEVFITGYQYVQLVLRLVHQNKRANVRKALVGDAVAKPCRSVFRTDVVIIL